MSVKLHINVPLLKPEVFNLFQWKVTQGIFKLVSGPVIKINKIENNTVVPVPFLSRTSNADQFSLV